MKPLRYLELLTSSLIFPHYCPSCGKDWEDGSGWLCTECWLNLPAPGRGLWWRVPKLRDKVIVAFLYNDTTRDFTHQMKFNGRTDIAEELGVRAASRIRDLVAESDIAGVVPVPLHPVRVRERGYDQDLVIARSVAECLDLPLITGLIKRAKNRPPQSRLSNIERLSNLRGAFVHSTASVKRFKGAVLLVDDIIHTGATALGCISALSRAGISDVRVLAALG